MSKPLIHISYAFQEGPYGGSNQFAHALRNYLKNVSRYSSKPEKAGVILFVSHANLGEVLRLKKLYPEKLFVHRIDGPVLLHDPASNFRDRVTHWANKHIADTTIFQSKWSRTENYKHGFPKGSNEATITNASQPNTFNQTGKLDFHKSRKTKVIMTSWSNNKAKGYQVYSWLDDHVNFSKYELTFVGNSPVSFKNIKHLQPLPPNELAEVLKEHDIYITASENDACSNALIEALSCGLPAIAKDDGGHPEILKEGGELFEHASEIPLLLDRMVDDYHRYQSRISLPTLEVIGEKYLSFIDATLAQKGRIQKRINKRAELQYFLLKLRNHLTK